MGDHLEVSGGLSTGSWMTIAAGVGATAWAAVQKIAAYLANRIQSKESWVAELEDQRYKLIFEERKLDRDSHIEQQKKNSETTKELADAVGRLSDGLSVIPSLVDEVRDMNKLLERMADKVPK
jgi:hypothetical protein